jgi:hypothetical protein
MGGWMDGWMDGWMALGAFRMTGTGDTCGPLRAIYEKSW